MRMFSKSLATLAITAALILGANLSMASAQPGDGPSYQMQPYRGLSVQQQQEMQKIFVDNYAGMEATRQELAGKRMELDQLLESPFPDKGRIEKLSREIGELRGRLLGTRAEVRSELARKGLPPDYYADPAIQPGPCWGNRPYHGWGYGNGWHHHGGYRGHGHGGYGQRGGCWR